MFAFEEFAISLSFHFIYLLLGLFAVAGYTFFTYKYTVPAIGKSQKILLIILRTTALLILLLILFEPILTLIKKENISRDPCYLRGAKSRLTPTTQTKE